MNKSKKKEQGIALVLVVLATLIILAAASVVVQRAYNTKIQTDRAIIQVTLNEACKAGVNLGIDLVWNKWIESNGGQIGDLNSFEEYLESMLGPADTAEPYVLIDEGSPHRMAAGNAMVSNVSISRSEDASGIVFTISASATVGDSVSTGISKTAVQTLRVGGRKFKGFDYAVLANNITCILCHADFEALDLNDNIDPDKHGTFERIKIASLESLLARKGTGVFSAQSNVAGSVYTRGTVHNENYVEYTDATIAASTFKGYEIDPDTGLLVQDGSGDMNRASFMNTGDDIDGNPEKNGSLYLNYPEDPSAMTDGELPTSFPSIFPDLNQNRTVDDAEFSPAFDAADGSITGGIAVGFKDGDTYADTSLPAVADGLTMAELSGGTYTGNLILVGTDANPIHIDGEIVIDGDLLIKGKVRGKGKIKTRKNVYVVGDVTYDDAPGTFGQYVENGESHENGLALAAGGSVMMGDYLTRRAKDKIRVGGMWGDCFIDMRAEHKEVNAHKYTSRGITKDVGYFADGVTDPGWIESVDGYTEVDMAFTTSEMSQFNFIEHQKAKDDPNYRPRYYQLRESMPIYEYTGQTSESTGHTTWYNNPYVDTIDDLASATVHSMAPYNNWLSEEQLRHFWYDDEMTRPDSGRPLQFDGLLYSDNAIFCITRSKYLHNSNTRGQLIVKGGIVTADLGMFIPGWNHNVNGRDGLKMYYDRRVSDWLRVEDPTQVTLTRQVFMYNNG